MVAPATAQRLLAHVRGQALDILFKDVRDIPRGLSSIPSSDLIRSRWSSLSASAAAQLAATIDDTDLLDYLADREKRITVRRELAGNRNLSEATRLYFLQEGLRLHDREVIAEALCKFSPTVLLVMLSQDEALRRYSNDRLLGNQIADSGDSSLLIAIDEAFGRSYLESLLVNMVSNNPTSTLKLIAECGLEGLRLRHAYRRINLADDDVENHRLLLTLIDDPEYRKDLALSFAEQPKELAAISPELLPLMLTGKTKIDDLMVAVFSEHDMSAYLLANDNPQFATAEAADELYALARTEMERHRVIAAHPDYTRAVSLIDDDQALADNLQEILGGSRAVDWCLSHAAAFGIDRMWSLVGRLHEVTLSERSLTSLATSLAMTNDDVIDTVPVNLMARARSLPTFERHQNLLARVSSDDEAHRTTATALLAMNGVKAQTALEAVRYLLAAGGPQVLGVLAEWLRRADEAPEIRSFLKEDPDIINALIKENPRLLSSDWAVGMVDVLTPPYGWGSVSNDRVIAAAMEHLHGLVGDERPVWESILTLWDQWSGSLASLAETSRRM